MRILINDKMQFASGVPAEIISPALSDRYNTSDTFTATFDDAEVVNCIGIGYTDATEIEIRNDNPFGAAVINLPLESDALDVSGNGNDGTATDITWTGGVANFNGTSSKIVRDFTDIVYPKMTICFWFKMSSSAQQCIFSTKNTSGDTGSNAYSTNGIWIIDNLPGNTRKIADYADSAWHFASTELTNSALNKLTIGMSYASTFKMTGQLSNFYIFNRALTDAERTSIYNGDMLQTLTLTPRTDVTRKYNNGLYLLNEISTSKFTITHNGNYIGRIGIGEYRTLGTAPSKEIGFYTTTESRETLSGQTIPGAGGYYGRRFVADVRYKFTEEIYNDLETAYQTQIQRSFPYFLLLDDEQHKVPDTMLHFYAASDKPLSLLQSSSYKFLYSYKFNFEERF